MNETLLSVLRFFMPLVSCAGSLLSVFLIAMQSSSSGKLAVYGAPLILIFIALPSFILLTLATLIHNSRLAASELTTPHRRGALVLKLSWAIYVSVLLLLACCDSAGSS